MHKILKRLFHLSDEASVIYTRAGILTGIFNIAKALPVVLLIILFNQLYCDYVDGTKTKISLLIYIGIGLLFVVLIFASYYIAYKDKYLGSGNEDYRLRVSLAEKIRKLPMSYLGKKDLSDLTSTIMDDVSTVEGSLTTDVSDIVGTVLSSIVFLIALGIYNWHMTLYLVACIPLAAIGVSVIRLITTGVNRKNRANKLAVSDGIQEYLDNIQVLQASEKKQDYEAALSKKVHKGVPGLLLYEFLAGMSLSWGENMLRSGLAIIIIAGGSLLVKGQITVTCFLAFLMIAPRFYEPLCLLVEKIGSAVYSLVAVERINTLMEQEVQTGNMKVDSSNTSITFDHVSFSYNKKEEVLHDVSFTAKQGEITALVGPSGCGKSTLCRLAARFWDVEQGRIYCGERDVKDVDPETLMKNYSFVFQDVVLFNDTIYNNIKIGKENATREEILAAARMAQCESFIEKLPDGYDTVIGENGKTLSGGERQRLSIARAFLKDAPIILLDETTASIDPENETKIQQAIGRLVQGKTVLIIAHKLRSIVDCDNIVVLEKGRLVEQGTHNQLISNNGLYNKLYRLQNESLTWEVTSIN